MPALPEIPIVTVTLARGEREGDLLLTALRELTGLVGGPVLVTDGGSTPEFRAQLRRIPGLTVTDPPVSGLTAQVRQSLLAGGEHSSGHVLYTEPDKSWFFRNRLVDFLRIGREILASDPEHLGLLLPTRSAASFMSYPAAQRGHERATDDLLGEITGVRGDFTYGPRIIAREVVAPILESTEELGWGWLSAAVVLAHRSGRAIRCLEMDLPCPEEDRWECAEAARYREAQHRQHRAAIAWAEQCPLRTGRLLLPPSG